MITKGRLVMSGCLVLNDRNEVLLLYRKKHNHYETPGGKVHPKDCSNPLESSKEELAKTAEREFYEEIGGVKIGELKYFGNTDFTIPDGRLGVAHKFVTRLIEGEPRIKEPELFEWFDWLQLEKLEKFQLSPDLKILLPKLKKLIKTTNRI
ncbi:MAG: NUDIX hydrolase [Candidatus Woesearchaeota archaeon]